MDSSRIPENGWYTAHRIGDLVRVTKEIMLNNGASDYLFSNVDLMGVVIKTPKEVEGTLFIEVYIFEKSRMFSYVPQELEIISNIDI
mgnify:FL=1